MAQDIRLSQCFTAMVYNSVMDEIGAIYTEHCGKTSNFEETNSCLYVRSIFRCFSEFGLKYISVVSITLDNKKNSMHTEIVC